MKSFDFGKLGGTRLGLSLLAIGVALLGVACGSGGGDDTNTNPIGAAGTAGSSMLPPLGGNPAAGAPAPSGGQAGMVAPPSGGAAGMIMTGGAGMGGSTPMTGGAGAAGNPPAGGMGGMAEAGAGGMAGGAAGMAGGGTAGTMVTPGGSCLEGDKDYFAAGKFTSKMETKGSVKFWVPSVPAGCKVPVIHLANGTGATCSAYGPSLERMASHGFLAMCYENPNTGAGDQGLMAFKTALMEYPDLADMRFGSTGHSQGGQASFTVMQLIEAEYGDKAIYAGLAMEPASGFGSQPRGGTWQSVYAKIKSPFLMFSGSPTDGLVSQGWVQQAFDALNDSVEAYHWTKAGATHIPVPNGEEQQLSIAWFRWKLLGDNDACIALKKIPGTGGWVQADVQAEQKCM